MEKKEIIALLEALCERPLAECPEEATAELQAFCREAAQALSQADDAPAGADTDRLTAALAVLLSGSDMETARRTVEEAVVRSAAARLDAQSALAFVDAVGQAPQAAPADLVEDILAVDRVAAAGGPSRRGAGMSALWPLIAGTFWPARHWRIPAAFTVLLVAGAVSWSLYGPPTHPIEGGRAPSTAKATSEQPARADAAAPPRPALATAQPCEPPDRAGEVARAESSSPAGPAKAAESGADAACANEHQLADRPADEREAIAARERAEAARQAAARAAAEAAARAGPAQADSSGPIFGATGRDPAAGAARPAPAATPAARPAAPSGVR